jgi:uncharacterized membrane protein YeaQ/YmgE (transglycosylase-associated protein family)
VGVIGAYIGGFLLRMGGLSSSGGVIGSIIVATVGALVLLWFVRLIKEA